MVHEQRADANRGPARPAIGRGCTDLVLAAALASVAQKDTGAAPGAKPPDAKSGDKEPANALVVPVIKVD